MIILITKKEVNLHMLKRLNIMSIRIMMIILLILMIPYIQQGCKRINDENKGILRNLVSSENKKEVNLPDNNHSPLAYDKYIALKSNTDTFSEMMLIYDKNNNNYHEDLTIIAGNLTLAFYLDQIEVFEGHLGIRDWRTIPGTSEGYDRSFNIQDLALVFDYLEQHHDYFFDGAEYIGLEIPFVTPRTCICDLERNYKFSLLFFEPNGIDHCWSIHKCVDEYPSPEHPLYGLFQLLEEHFISQFE